MDLNALIKDLDGVQVETEASVLRRKSRDYFWYSPVLKRLLQDVMGDLVVSPRDEAEVARVLKACHAHRVPVTPRGAGTGNYGQAMPLSGGVVLDLHRMDQVSTRSGSRVVTGPGAVVSARPCASPRPPLRWRPWAASWPAARAGWGRCAGAGCAPPATCWARGLSPARPSPGSSSCGATT
jgi:hypothetical protein